MFASGSQRHRRVDASVLLLTFCTVILCFIFSLLTEGEAEKQCYVAQLCSPR